MTDGRAEHPPAVPALVDHLFRRRAGRMVASLTRVFGVARLQLAEDVVQEAMLAALRTWPHRGVPPDPGAWLHRTARNAAIDAVRRDASLADRLPAVHAWWERTRAAARDDDVVDEALTDDRLRLMFACCHPSIPPHAQVALLLKTVCGFGVDEVARGFLVPSATIAQRVVRAKRRLREASVSLDVDGELSARAPAVLDALALMFNEAHVARAGERLVRDDLMAETLRLARLVADHAATSSPAADALLASMLLHAARTPARTDGAGDLVLLADQDRRRWDRALIAEGVARLARSARGTERTPFHVQAAIAALHSTAPSWDETDWPAIRREYDRLLDVAPSPVVALNRTVAVAMTDGPAAALAALDALDDDPRLASYHLHAALRGEYLLRLERLDEARTWFEHALRLPCSDPERRLVARRLERCTTTPPGT